MLRRDFALSLLATGAALPALAQRVAPKEGSDYLRLGKPVPVEAPVASRDRAKSRRSMARHSEY